MAKKLIQIKSNKLLYKGTKVVEGSRTGTPVLMYDDPEDSDICDQSCPCCCDNFTVKCIHTGYGDDGDLVNGDWSFSLGPPFEASFTWDSYDCYDGSVDAYTHTSYCYVCVMVPYGQRLTHTVSGYFPHEGFVATIDVTCSISLALAPRCYTYGCPSDGGFLLTKSSYDDAIVTTSMPIIMFVRVTGYGGMNSGYLGSCPEGGVKFTISCGKIPE